MLDPSILVSPGTQHDPTCPVMPDAQAAIRLADEAESRARELAAAIEMLSALDTAADLNQAAEQAAAWLVEILSATRVLILWRYQSGSGLSLIADSDARNGESENAEGRLAIAAGEEVAARDMITRWPPAQQDSEGQSPACDRYALMAVAQLVRGFMSESMVGIKLSDSGGHDRGVVLVLNPRNDTSSTNFLHAIELPLASKLNGIQQLQPTRIESAIRIATELARSSRRNLILFVALVLGLTLLLPVTYRIAAELELQPVKHRFVAVPFDGPLESANVRPGDLVRQGDLLATINPREIEYELAGIRAELNRALQQKKGLMAEHDVAGSKIAALESDRLRLQSDLLQYRHDNLDIRSPISGVVVSGDLKQSEGMPMSRGETLFEIAPLGQMVVEISVPEDDVAHAREGMHCEFYVHALPNRTMSGTIVRLHPRAELRNHDNVYIAEVHIDDSENVLRPGMRGRASIFSDRHPLGWNLFHKAYFALRHAVGW